MAKAKYIEYNDDYGDDEVDIDVDLFSPKKPSSISGWEDSYFGGFRRTINDHPEIKIDYNIDFDFVKTGTKGDYLSWMESDKILKMFLSSAKNENFIVKLLRNATTKNSVDFFGNKIIKTTLDTKSQSRVIDFLISRKSELSPLFNHYKKFLELSSIHFVQKEEIENESGDGDSKPGDKEEDEKSSKKGKPKVIEISETTTAEHEKNLSDFKKALHDIREEKKRIYKSISGFNSKTRIFVETITDGEKTSYSYNEQRVADQLVQLLDITFDPTSDVVKNLRIGKLDVTKIAEVPAGNIAIYKQDVQNQLTKPFTVVILCDESGSMQGSQLDAQYRIVKSLYLAFSDILPQNKIFVYGHSGGDSPELYVYQDSYNPNFSETINGMTTRDNAENYDGPIIEEVYKAVRNVTDDRIIFIILSDGKPSGNDYGGVNDVLKMKQIIERCKRDEFVTIGVGINSSHVKELYEYSTVVNNMAEMAKKVSHIVNHVVKTEFQ